MSLFSPAEMHVQLEDDPSSITTTPTLPLLPEAASSQSNLSPAPVTNTKVAIPRQPSAVARPYGRRVPRACESCRHRKTKCSGDNPVCRQCRELSISCRYPVSWKEKAQNDLDQVSAKALDLENLVRDVASVVDGRMSARIKDVLEKHSIDNESPPIQSNSITPNDNCPDQAEESSSPSVGSLDAIDRVDEDLNRDENTRATGYMGKNSEVTWMQRLRREAEQRSQMQPGTYEPDCDSPRDGDFALHAVSYHLDDMDITPPGPVRTYWIPPRHLADQLFEDYLNTVHPFFPIISRPLFRAQYKNFFEKAARPGDKWLAILNLIFAIAAKHAHLRQAPWRGSEQDHLYYLTRARILSMDGDTLFSHPDLQQVQVEGLVAFYLLASDQINRAWRIAALAVRSAITLGINLRSTSETTTSVSKEARSRVWWCLYSFEHMLGIMTGRSTCIMDGICTSPLPFPFEEEGIREPMPQQLLNNPELRQEIMDGALASTYVRQTPPNPTGGKDARRTDKIRDTAWLRGIPANQGLCFLYYVDLAVITQEIVNKVYSINCINVPWTLTANRIDELRSRIDLWYTNLPDAFNFTQESDDGPDLQRQKIFLAFYYYSARITLGRPCLCRREARQETTIANQKETFSHEISVTTLKSSLGMLDLIPEEPDAVQLYQICPWWCILHFLMQATTVLLLELSFGSIHMREEEVKFLNAAKKGTRWLYAMSQFSIASRRAWELCDSNLRRIARGMNYDVSDIPSSSFVYEPNQQTFPTDGDNDMDMSVNQPTISNPTTSTPAATTTPYTTTTAAAPEPPTQFNLSELSGLPSIDLMPVPTDSRDAYFPYDPITGEFIRSFFPEANEGDSWDRYWG